MLHQNKGEKTAYFSRLVDFYFNRLSECQVELEQHSKEIIEHQKVQEIDEFDDYPGEILNTDKIEKSCDKLKHVIETIANDFEIWISHIRSFRPANIWPPEKVRS